MPADPSRCGTPSETCLSSGGFWNSTASQFGDGLFQATLAGGLLFNPERAADPWAVAGAFAVLFLPYSLVGPFAGALLDRWDRRAVLIGANLGRLLLVICVSTLLAIGASDFAVLCGALAVNGFGRFVTSGMSAALPHVVPRRKVITMNSVATAVGATATFLGANFMLLPRWLFGAGTPRRRQSCSWSPYRWRSRCCWRCASPPRARSPTTRCAPSTDQPCTRWPPVGCMGTHGGSDPAVASTLAGLAAHRMVFGINTLLVLVIVRHSGSADVVAGSAPPSFRRDDRSRLFPRQCGDAWGFAGGAATQQATEPSSPRPASSLSPRV